MQLGSKHAHFFYEHGLKWLALPVDIDSGHPPVFGYFLAVLWTVFGKTLPVSHFALLPFLWLNILLLWKIGHRLGGNKWGAFLPALIFIDPVLLGQSVMISPDIVLLTGFLLALEGVWSRRNSFVVLGILVLCAISMRGMMTAAAIFSWAVLLPLLREFDLKKALRSGIFFLPGFAFSAWFLCWHWYATGWIGYHAGSPWAAAFKAVAMEGLLRNLAIVGWRFLDFGRVGECLVLAGILYGTFRAMRFNIKTFIPAENALLSLFFCLLFFLLPSALLYQNLSAHRYFIPVFVAIHLLVFQWIATEKAIDLFRWKLAAMRAKIALSGVIVLCLATGNCWIYPRGISMDWDSTLAHWPYHKLRQEAIEYLDSEKIDFASVGSAFPNLNTGEQLMLNGDLRQFSKIDLEQNSYVMSSNIFNDISEADYQYLQKNRTLVWERRRGGVWIEVYRK